MEGGSEPVGEAALGGEGRGWVCAMSVCGRANEDSLSRWVRECFRRLDDTTKDLKHIWHLKGRSPECTLRCLLRLERSANDLPHSVQEKGRSPVWTNMCRRRSQDATKALSQFWHLYAGCRNFLLHLSQGKGFSPECVRR
uniref:Uncharacterized protein n=1 Tax=Pygocentrus nattereri TaxID=42514 RepID=A0A3B4DJK4_PYGNA